MFVLCSFEDGAFSPKNINNPNIKAGDCYCFGIYKDDSKNELRNEIVVGNIHDNKNLLERNND